MLTNDSDIPLLATEQQKIQDDFDSRTTGAGKFGKILVSNSKLRYLEFGMSPKDLQLTGTNIDKLRTICSAYNVDSSLFNDPANKTYSNMTEAKKAFYTDCVLPWAEFIINNLNKYFAEKLKTDEKVVIDKSKIEVLKEVNKTLSDKVVQELSAGILTQEQALSILYPNMIFEVKPPVQ
jgi:HK97 family phage portal protein